jgi:hypothetical protein
MRKLLFLVLLILAGYIGFMYFFGKGEEKAQAELVVQETVELGKAIGDFLKKQKGKYDDGEFDQLIDQVSASISKLKKEKNRSAEEVGHDLDDLEKELRQIDPSKMTDDQKEKWEKLLKELKSSK